MKGLCKSSEFYSLLQRGCVLTDLIWKKVQVHSLFRNSINSLIIVDKYNYINIVPSIEAELKQSLAASTKMNSAKSLQIERLNDTARKREGTSYCFML